MRVTPVNPRTVGSGAKLIDLFPLPTWAIVILITGRWWVFHPKTTLCLISFLWVWARWDYSWWGTLLLLFVCAIALALLWVAWMMRHCGWKGWKHLMKSIWRITFVNLRWAQACKMAGIGGDRRRGFNVPKMRRLQITEWGVRGRVRTGGKLGIPITRIEESGATDSMRASMAAERVRVSMVNMGLGWVEIQWQDALATQIVTTEAMDRAAYSDGVSRGLTRIPFGKDDDGLAVTIDSTRSLLVVGESGSGKSSILWALIRALGMDNVPHKLHVIDPKGGVELSQLEHYEHTASYCQSGADSKDLIKRAAADMFKRADRMKADGIRKGTISRAYPLNVILIDELLLLKTLLSEGVDGALGQVLSQGRAFGYTVWACSQMGQKDVIGPVRDLFVQRLCLAVRSGSLTDAVLGDGAEGDGARCSEILLDTPGIGYMYAEGRIGYRRFRAEYIDDAEIARITGQMSDEQVDSVWDTLILPQLEGTVGWEPEIIMLEDTPQSESHQPE